MAIQSNASTEEVVGGIKTYSGLTNVKVMAVNPTMRELHDMDINVKQEPNYKVEFSGEEFDIGGCADPSNNKFVCPSGEGGKYFFYFRIGYSNPNTSGHRILYIQRANSGGSFSAIKELQDNGAMYGAAAAVSWTGSAILDIDAGQEVRLEAYQTSGGNMSTNPVSGQNLYFGGFKLAGTT